MLGLFVSEIVKVSAGRLMMQLGIMRRHYALAEDKEMFAHIRREFDQERYAFEGSAATIAPNETPYFLFRVLALLNNEKGREIAVYGKDEFRGFMMTVAAPDSSEWQAMAPREQALPPTRNAIALVSYLDRHYGVLDSDKMTGSLFTASRYLAKRRKRFG